MKKMIVGMCGVLIFAGGLISILYRGVLKASELEVHPPETEVVDHTVDTPENSTPVAGEQVYSEPPEVIVEEPVIEPDEPETSQTEIPQSSDSSSEANVPETSSTTVPSSSESSTSLSDSSTTNSSNNSTIPSSESASSNTQTPPSQSVERPTTSSSIEPTTPSTDQSASFDKPSVPTAPPVVSVVPTNPASSNPSSVNRVSGIETNVPEAFSETSTVKLPDELRATKVVQSDLKGFELPLLSSFKDKNQAVMIYEGIKQIGIEQEEDYTSEQFAQQLYQSLFSADISDSPKKVTEELPIGSLLYQKSELLGIYIGSDYYLTVSEVENDDTTDTDNTKETQRQVVIETMDLEGELSIVALPECTLTAYGQEVLKEYPASMPITENQEAKLFIEKIGEDARKLGQEYDVFASVMIAQALLESGSGTSGLSLAPNHNLFGIKGTYQGQSVSMATKEDRGNGELYSIRSAFRKYPNYAASLGDYVELIRGGITGNAQYYKEAWRSSAKNYLRTTSALTGTYATDHTYGQKLNSIIALYHLTTYDQVNTEGNAGVFIQGKEEIPEEYRNRMQYPDYNGVDYNSSGSYPIGQCTWYAYNRVRQLGKSVDDYMGNGGQWAIKGKALGYEVSQKPKAGWLISFKPGVAGSDPRYGHVAFVEVVTPEGILISEGNVYGGTIISYRVIDNALATSDQVSYIKAK